MTSQSSFTLLELLIVIGILTVLATALVLVLNPVEYLKQARDASRIQDLQALNKALSLYEAERQTGLGSPNTVYVSLPSSQSNCSDLGLPSLPSGWSYACAPESSYRKVDGSGWAPVNFTLISQGSPLSRLPVDPVNSASTGQYYTYAAGGGFELTAVLESQNYRLSGGKDAVSRDGGDSYSLYEAGNKFSISPYSDSGLSGYWRLDESGETSAADSSGNNNNGVLTGGPTWVSGKAGRALSFSGANANVDMGDVLKFTNAQAATISLWFNVSSFSGNYQFLVARFNGSGTRTDYAVVLVNSATVGYAYDDAAAAEDVFSSWTVSTINPGTWHHLAVTLNTDNTVTGYYDGLLLGTQSSALHNDYASTKLYVGEGTTADYNGDSGFSDFNGLMDEIRIYNRALSAAEIKAIYDATK